MAEKSYEKPSIRILGEVTDLTLSTKPGIYFDYGNATEGAKMPPPPGTPGTGTS